MTDWTRFTGTALVWEKTGSRVYELRAGEALLAHLRWQSECGSLALGECAEGRWTFKRMGFFNPYVTVRTADAPTDLGILRAVQGVTQLRLADGRVYTWRRLRPRSRQTVFADASDRAVVEFSPGGGRGTPSATLSLGTGSWPPGTPALLALLGWYRLVLEHQDEEAAVMAATMATITAAIS